MSQEITRVVDELQEAADSYTPPPVPVDQLLTRGRRRRRRKQGLTIIATAAAAAAAIAIGLVVVPSISHNVQPAKGSSVSIHADIRFVLPPGWREIPAIGASGGVGASAYWTNQETGPQCGVSSSGVHSCGPPVKAIHRAGVLVLAGFAPAPVPRDLFHPNSTVAGRPASVRAADCSHTAPQSSIGRYCYRGARRVLVAEILSPDSRLSRGSVVLFGLRAYFGPGDMHRSEQHMRKVLETARPWLPWKERHAALAAAHREANRQATGEAHGQEWPRNIAEVTAKVYPTPITDWNVKHYCHTDRLLEVTVIGRFPRMTTSGLGYDPRHPQRSTSTEIHALDDVVTYAGRICLSGGQTGHVRPDPAAVVLFKR